MRIKRRAVGALPILYAERAGPVGIGGDNQIADRVNEDALAEYAASAETAILIDPPLIAIAASVKIAIEEIGRRILGQALLPYPTQINRRFR